VTQAPDNSQKKDAQPATPPKPFIVPMDVTVPLAPTAFQADGKTHLAYELHITNFSGQSVSLAHIEVLSGLGHHDLKGGLVWPHCGCECSRQSPGHWNRQSEDWQRADGRNLYVGNAGQSGQSSRGNHAQDQRKV
jgi:hypothetical protein